jgi:hypothetical protein
MRKPARSKRARNAHPTPHEYSKGRLHDNFEISAKFKPYANQLRVRIARLDLIDPKDRLQLEDARTKMTDILIKNKISNEVAQRAVARALDIAADHQFDVLRLDQDLGRLAQSGNDRDRLTKRLRNFAQMIPRLPPLARGKLNKIIVEQEWMNFDTEMFHELIHALLDALKKSSPAVIAAKAISAIKEAHRDSTNSAASKIVPTARPAICELWEIIPAETRTRVEASLRNWRPPTRRPTIEFLSHVVALLETFQPRLRRGRRPAIEQRFAQQIAGIWDSLGWNVGRACNGSSDCQSTFQQFTRLALTGVRDGSRLSGRQITNLKSRRQTHRRWRQRGLIG